MNPRSARTEIDMVPTLSFQLSSLIPQELTHDPTSWSPFPSRILGCYMSLAFGARTCCAVFSLPYGLLSWAAQRSASPCTRIEPFQMSNWSDSRRRDCSTNRQEQRMVALLRFVLPGTVSKPGVKHTILGFGRIPASRRRAKSMD